MHLCDRKNIPKFWHTFRIHLRLNEEPNHWKLQSEQNNYYLVAIFWEVVVAEWWYWHCIRDILKSQLVQLRNFKAPIVERDTENYCRNLCHCLESWIKVPQLMFDEMPSKRLGWSLCVLIFEMGVLAWDCVRRNFRKRYSLIAHKLPLAFNVLDNINMKYAD